MIEKIISRIAVIITDSQQGVCYQLFNPSHFHTQEQLQQQHLEHQ